MARQLGKPEKNSTCKTAVSRLMQNGVDNVIKSDDVSQKEKEENSSADRTTDLRMKHELKFPTGLSPLSPNLKACIYFIINQNLNFTSRPIYFAFYQKSSAIVFFLFFFY